MKHFNIEDELNRVSDYHELIIKYLEETLEYDDLEIEDYVVAYEEAEKMIENGELD